MYWKTIDAVCESIPIDISRDAEEVGPINGFPELPTEEADQPVGVQLVGCDPHFMGEAAAQVEGMGFPVVDLNLGCPVPKVVSKGGGSELLREPEKARSIFYKVVRSVKRVPVMVKMRIGFEDKTGREGVEIARIAQDCGVSAVAVHGLTWERLKPEPVFAAVADRFLDFVGDSPLVAHNASFDMRVINAELTRLGRPPIPMSRSIDTVQMARIRFPGAPASLDALCRRFGVDNSGRDLHGALLDAQLLAEVYLHLLGDRQRGFDLAADRRASGQTAGRRRPSERVTWRATPARFDASGARNWTRGVRSTWSWRRARPRSGRSSSTRWTWSPPEGPSPSRPDG